MKKSAVSLISIILISLGYFLILLLAKDPTEVILADWVVVEDSNAPRWWSVFQSFEFPSKKRDIFENDWDPEGKENDDSKKYELISIIKNATFSEGNKKCPRYLIPGVSNSPKIGHYFDIWYTAWALAHYYNLIFLQRDEFYPKNSKSSKRLGLTEGERNIKEFCLTPEDIVKSDEHDYCKKFKPELIMVDVPYFQLKYVGQKESTFDEMNMNYQECNIVFRLSSSQTSTSHSLFTNVLQERYEEANERYPIELVYDPKKVSIALHIRKGNKKGGPASLMSNINYLKLCHELLRSLSELGYSQSSIEFFIFSKGFISDFEEFSDMANVNYQLNKDTFYILRHLAKADILIGSPSSFSSMAAVLSGSSNVKIFPNFGHTKSTVVVGSDWVILDDELMYNRWDFVAAWKNFEDLKQLNQE